VPPEDYYRIVHALPSGSFVHTPSFLGLHYSDDLILLELTFIAGRSKETRLALLRELNERVVAATGISPDDLAVLLYELPARTSRSAGGWRNALTFRPKADWAGGPLDLTHSSRDPPQGGKRPSGGTARAPRTKVARASEAPFFMVRLNR
jgi:hypothetical protein